MNEDIRSYIHIREARELLGVSSLTLKRYHEQGKIRVIRRNGRENGAYMFHIDDIRQLLGLPSGSTKRRIVYARVSSVQQRPDLERQVEFLSSKFPEHEVVTDVGSGINWKRKGLQTILELACRRELEEVVVAHRDRLCRFAYELFERWFTLLDVQLVCLDENDATQGKSSEAELADDLLSIVHIYSCRHNGRRRYHSSNKEDSTVSQHQSEETPSNV
jgi:putative resolvase